MKFTHGGWLQRKGVATFSPVQVFEDEVLPDRVRLVAATHPIVDKGSTLQDAALFLEVSAPCEGAIRVQAVHHRGRRDPGPRFEIPEGDSPVEIAKTADAIRFTTAPTPSSASASRSPSANASTASASVSARSSATGSRSRCGTRTAAPARS